MNKYRTKNDEEDNIIAMEDLNRQVENQNARIEEYIQYKLRHKDIDKYIYQSPIIPRWKVNNRLDEQGYFFVWSWKKM